MVLDNMCGQSTSSTSAHIDNMGMFLPLYHETWNNGHQLSTLTETFYHRYGKSLDTDGALPNDQRIAEHL